MMKSFDFKKTKIFNVDDFWFANDKAQEKFVEKSFFLIFDDWINIINDNQQQLINFNDVIIFDVIRAIIIIFIIINQDLIDERRHENNTTKYLKNFERLYKTFDEFSKNSFKYQFIRYMNLDEKMISLKFKFWNNFLKQIDQQVQILYLLNDENLTLLFINKKIKTFDFKITRIAKNA